MKNLSKTLFFCGIIIFLAFSCEEEDENAENPLFFEILINSEVKTAEFEENNISFKFCLLNETEIPSTIFKEGENFIFSLTIENKNDFDIIIDGQFINSEFFKVYKKENDDEIEIGTPWFAYFCEYSLLPEVINLSANETLLYEIPWINSIYGMPINLVPFCFQGQDISLNVGEYYTGLNFNMKYNSSNNEYNINNVSIKINFEIE